MKDYEKMEKGKERTSVEKGKMKKRWFRKRKEQVQRKEN